MRLHFDMHKPERKLKTMKPWQELLAVALMLMAFWKLRSALRKNRERKTRDFTRKLETVLQPRETIKVICPSRGGNCILTSRRLLFDTEYGFTAVPLTGIQSVQGYTKTGKKTNDLAQMASLTIKGEKEYTIRPTGDGFAVLAKQLIRKVEKQKEKKKKPTAKTGKRKANGKK